MPAFAPEATGEEVLIVFLLFLLFHPLALLPVCCYLKSEAEEPQRNASKRTRCEIWDGGESSWGNGIEGCYWKHDERDPGSLSKEGDDEFRGSGTDLVESRVLPIFTGDPGEEECSHCVL